MYTYLLLFQVIALSLVNVNLIASINLDFRDNGLFLKNIFKYKRNPVKNGQVAKLRPPDESHKNKANSKNSLKEVNESQPENKLSRVELVFGSYGLKLLNSSNVLVLGANELSAKIITHLIRSGVSSVTLWDTDRNSTKNVLEELSLLNPDSNLKGIHTDPTDLIKSGNFSTVILANQPISEAIRYSDVFHKKCNFVYAFVAGSYGLVINDFGTHRVAVKSDFSYPEHLCKLVYSGDESCLEITGSDLYHYAQNDLIQVRYTHESKSDSNSKDSPANGSSNGYNVSVDTFKILSVDKSDKNSIKVWISSKNKKPIKSVLSVKKVDDSLTLNFSKIGTLINRLLETNRLKSLLRSLSDRYFNCGPINKLIIGPNCNNSLNINSLSVLASFLSLNKANSFNLKPDLDSNNFYDLTKQLFSSADYQTVCNFNELREVRVPAMTTLIGGLAAQEAMKAMTKLFTPTDLIIVDRSDIFTFVGGKLVGGKEGQQAKYDLNLKENALKTIEHLKRNSFLLIGAGALGCEYLRLLAEMRVPTVAVVDNDVVETSNLSRQALFTQSDIGKPKAECAANNLRLFHSATHCVPYNELFTEKAYEHFKSELSSYSAQSRADNSGNASQRDRLARWVGISAVDNVEGRLALDGFCAQNGMPLVESGIYGMQCSTSLTVPYLTESFSSSAAGEHFFGKNSCTVKGVPENIDDCVFYSIELFSWLFNGQNVMLGNFLKNPIKSVELALERGSKHFYTLISIINDYLLIIKHQLTNRHASYLEAGDKAELRKWALRVYDKYIGFETDYKNLLIDTLCNLKLKSLKQFYPYSTKTMSKFDNTAFDYNKLKSLINQGFSLFKINEANKIDRGLFLSELDNYINAVKNRNRYDFTGNDDTSTSKDAPIGADEPEANVMVLEEGCKHSGNFIHIISNLRARKYKIPELDKLSLIKKAKNIVPAVSTCVSIAASLSILELYKLSLLSTLNLGKMEKIKLKSTLSSSNGPNKDVDDKFAPNLLDNKVDGEVVLNDKVTLRCLVHDDEVCFYNKYKPIFKLYPYDYSRNELLTRYFTNNFFNTATLQFVSNIANPPKIYTLSHKNLPLNQLSLSYWDYIYVNDYDNRFNESDANMPKKLVRHKLVGTEPQNKFKKFLSRNKLNFLNKSLKDLEGFSASSGIYLYELVELIEFVFNVRVDALTHQRGYIIVSRATRGRLLKDLLEEQMSSATTDDHAGSSILKSDRRSRELILHIIARDKGTNESIELPDIQYHF